MIDSISYSRVSTYSGCPQEHYFSYVKRLEPNRISRPLSFGTDFHRLLEHRSKDNIVSIFEEIKDAYYNLPSQFQTDLGDDYVDDLREVFEDYMEVWKDEQLPLDTEHEFKIPMFKYKGQVVYFHGIIDEVYGDENGEPLFIGDHKTFNQRPDLAILTMNQQACLYAKAFQIKYGKYPTKFRWDYIKSKPAQYPVWLEKSGRFSEASSSSITPFSWLRACKEHGIEDEAILAKAQNYSQNIDSFFFRYDVDMSPEMIENVWEDFLAISKEIVLKGETNKRKVVTRDCTWCDFRPLCFAQFTGADLEYIISKDFRLRPEKEAEENGTD